MLVLVHSLSIYLTADGEWEEEKTEKVLTQADLWKNGFKSIQNGGETFVTTLNGFESSSFDGGARQAFEAFSGTVDDVSNLFAKLKDMALND